MIEVKRVGFSDFDAVVALRGHALESHPHAFGAAREEDRLMFSRDRETILGTVGQSVVFGAYEGQALVGMAGLARAAGAKRRHKAIIWGMYVVPGSSSGAVSRAR